MIQMGKHLSALGFAVAALASVACCGGMPDEAPARECIIAPYGTYAEGLTADITPKGWIAEFLQRQQSGLTGHPEAMCYPFNSCLWAGEITRETEEHGDDWWRYEQTGYYSDGLLKLGYLLRDPELITKGEDGVRYTMSHLTEDGSYGFREKMSGGNAMSVQDALERGEWLLIWPQAVYFRVLQTYYEATGDEDIPAFLEKHFLNFRENNFGSTRNIVNVEGLTWTYARTGNHKLIELAEEGWRDGHFELNESVCLQEEPLDMHGVSCCEELKVPMLLYAYTGNRHYLDLALRAEQKLEDEDMLPDGIPSSAEYLAGKVTNHSHETCDISDFTWSMGYYLMTTGEAKWGDRIEKAVFNAGPGAVGKDFKSLQYFSSVNQFTATGTSNNNEFMHGKSWMEYRPVHETECCAGNVHRFMPNYVSRMWLQSGKDGVVAALYGPSELRLKLSDGSTCSIAEETAYPFEDTIGFGFKFSKRGRHQLSFSFRIPEWAGGVCVSLNGKPVEYRRLETGFGIIERQFSSGDRITIGFDLPIEVKDFAGQGHYVQRGPVLFTYPIPTRTVEDTTTYAHLNGKVSGNPDFKCWSKTPAGKWNYALAHCDSLSLTRTGSTSYPFDEPCMKIRVPVTEIAGWELDEGIYTPENPAEVKPIDGSLQEIELVPYGSTYLRLTVFPVLK